MTDGKTNKHEQFEAETGQEVPRAEKGASVQREGSAATSLSAIAAPSLGGQQRREAVVDDEGTNKLRSEETTGQPSLTTPSAITKREPRLQKQESDSSGWGKPQTLNCGLADLTEIEGELSQPSQSFGGGDFTEQRGLEYKLQSASLQSLPASFSPAATPRSPHTYLGYNPLRIPEVTMSQPDLAHSVDRMRAREDIVKLREATVRVCGGRGSV